MFITDESLIYVAVDGSIRVRGISLRKITQKGVTSGWKYQYEEYSIGAITEKSLASAQSYWEHGKYFYRDVDHMSNNFELTEGEVKQMLKDFGVTVGVPKI